MNSSHQQRIQHSSRRKDCSHYVDQDGATEVLPDDTPGAAREGKRLSKRGEIIA